MKVHYVWDPFVRLFHWGLVAAFCVAFYTHNSEWDRLIHIRAGYTACGLILARIVWGTVSKGYANFNTFPLSPVAAIRYILHIVFRRRAKHYIGHNPTGALVIYLMLIVGIIAVSSGILTYESDWLLEDYSGIFRTIHHYTTWGWLVLVAIHIIGVIFESVIHHDNLILAMITGRKIVCKIDDRPAASKKSLVS
jgi:cytochrome b